LTAARTRRPDYFQQSLDIMIGDKRIEMQPPSM